MVPPGISHYRILSKLGAGGMGEVYLAEDTRLDRKVALKLLPEPFTQDEDRVHRFVQEAKATSALNHPNIITIFEIGQIESRHYIATEFIEGETLRDQLSRGPLTVREALEVAIQVASALTSAHQAGVIHRDIKPENVMVRVDNIVKVLDFGLAKLTEQRVAAPAAVDDEAATIVRVKTDPGTVLGTVGYMAPEQVRGKEVDGRADVFSLGVVLYEMLTGRAPFAGETPADVIAALLGREPLPISRLAPETPAELRHIVNKTLRKDAEERYQSVKSLLADLKALRRELEFATDLERSMAPEVSSVRRGATGAVVAALPEADESEGLDLAHVLFCDIVGYSLQPIDQQTDMMRRLQEIVRQTEAYRRAETSQQLVRLPAGDGMALAFLQDPAAPVRCAIEIARALKSHPDIRLRMGVNTGPVFRSADINANRNVVGSGINLAQRVMDSGDAGHILVSHNVAEVLSQVTRWQPLLHDLGEIEVKHGVRLHISNLYDEEIGNAETPAKVKSQSAAPTSAERISSAEYLVSGIKKNKRSAALLLAVAVAVVSAVGYWFFTLRSAHEGIDSLAVLPFENKSGIADSEALSDGLAETLIYRLSQVPNLKVSPTSSVFRYKGKETDPLKIGSELGVQAVMSGRMVQRGENLTISVELVDVRNNKTLWGEQYERRLSDLLATQREIATEITQRLQLKLTGEGEQKLAKKYTNSNDAYQLYMKGRFHWAKRTKGDLLRSIEYFKQAIELDPNFALSYVGIAESYNSMGKNPDISPGEAIPLAKAAAARALEIDPSLAEAHSAFADSLAIYDWNWAESEREFKRAIELDPNVSYIHLAYALGSLTAAGRTNEMVAELERALELEPLSMINNTVLISGYLYARDNDKALQQARKTYDLDPNFPLGRQWVGEAYIANKMYDEAIAFGLDGLQKSPSYPAFLYVIGHAYAQSGRKAEALQFIDKLREVAKTRYVRTYYLASIYIALGDKDKAFGELERSIAERDCYLPRIKIDPLMNPLRDDPRFKAILQRLNLSE